jgi:hypothetical protein
VFTNSLCVVSVFLALAKMEVSMKWEDYNFLIASMAIVVLLLMMCGLLFFF